MDDVLSEEIDPYGGLNGVFMYVRSVAELLMYKSFDDAGLSRVLVPEEDDFELGLGGGPGAGGLLNHSDLKDYRILGML